MSQKQCEKCGKLTGSWGNYITKDHKVYLYCYNCIRLELEKERPRDEDENAIFE